MSSIQAGGLVEVAGLGPSWDGLQFRVLVYPYGQGLVRGKVTRSGTGARARDYTPGNIVTFYACNVRPVGGFGIWYKEHS